ncbi:MAG: PHP domain-containing protein, partial [Thermocrispum sp.]
MEPSAPAEALRRIAFLLERAREPTYRVRAFRSAAATVDALPPDELRRRAGNGTLTELKGIGKVTALAITEALNGEVPVYLRRLEATGGRPVAEGGTEIRAALRGDLHTHSDWSDGGSPIEEMALAARDLGHEYLVLTDHSPRLTVANGLSPDRLREQLDVVAALNDKLDGIRILTGIEVDIHE